ASKTVVGDMYGIEAKRINDDLLGRTLDSIYQHVEDIQSEIALSSIGRYKIDLEAIHYDLTSLYFEGEMESSDIVRYGYSRDHRPDRKQINLGMDVTAEGAVPINHKVYEGNRADVKTVIENMRALKKRLKRCIILQDRGTVSKTILTKIEDGGFLFIVGLSRNSKVKEFLQSLNLEDFRVLDYKRGGGLYKGLDTRYNFGREYRAVVIHSSQLEERRKTRKRHMDRILKRLRDMDSKLNTRRYRKKKYAQEQLFKLKSRYPKVWKYFKIELKGEDNSLTLNYRVDECVLQKDEYIDGMYILLTNVEDYSMENILISYRSRAFVENRIKNLKSHLRIRPIYLHKDRRIVSLVLITILALMIYSIIELLCRRGGYEITARTALEYFEKLNVVYIKDEEGWFISIEDPTPIQSTLLNLMEIDIHQITLSPVW
ncbi:MAG: IS1634 family transposase, partial [Thermoplasmata archaeon]